MKPVVLVNASAGTAVQFAGEDLARRIEQAFEAARFPVEVREIVPRALEQTLDEVARARRPLLMAGGDGSVSAAVQRFAGTGVPLGVLPFGTYNLLANDLGMAPDIEAAATQIAAGQERRIDLGKVGRRRFHTLGGIGFFSRVARQRAQVRRSIPSKVVGAAVAAIRSFTRGGSLDIEVSAGERRESFRTPAVLITNNLMEPGTWRRRRLDAGVFEINILRGDVPFPLLRGGLAAVMGSWRDSAEIVSWTAPRLTLSFRRPRVFLSLDGEIRRPRTPLTFEILPGALTVLTAPAPPA